MLTFNIFNILLPPSESWSNLVSFESLYGTCKALFVLSPRAEITLPNANYNAKNNYDDWNIVQVS